MIFIFDDKQEPADIFADIPSEKAPVPSGQPPTGTTPMAVGASGVILESAPFGKKWVILGLVAVLLVGSGATAFFLLRGTGAQPPAEQPQSQPESQSESQPEPQPEPEPESAPAAETDSDGDGLVDARESQIGTDPSRVDSDDDGLSDREELEVYTTDPLNPDTDADSFRDGDEVSNGYDPKGPGRLLELPS